MEYQYQPLLHLQELQNMRKSLKYDYWCQEVGKKVYEAQEILTATVTCVK